MFKSPALQPIGLPYLTSILQDSIRRMGGRGGLNFLLKPDVDLVAFTNSKHTIKSPASKASITLWNKAMDQYRSGMHPYITEAYPSGSLLSGSGLSPYYLCNVVFGHIKGSTCIYHHPLFLAYFQYHTLSDIIMQQKQGTDANNYLMESIKKLEVLTIEAEKNGMDKGLLYRNEFEVTRIHAQSLFSSAIGINNSLETAIGYGRLLTVDENGLIEPILGPLEE